MDGTAGRSLGARTVGGGVEFAVWSGAAERIQLSLYAGNGDFTEEASRLDMARGDDGIHRLFVPGLGEGALYGLRADGPYDPPDGFWFDPNKLLIDPYALQIDRAYRYDALMAAPRSQQVDTGPMMPKAVVTAPPVVEPAPPLFAPGRLIYEINVRGFTMLHKDVPEQLRGTVAALAHPAVIGHLRKLGVGAVELMPITASMDERHLPPLGLRNAWGYNPVSFMALDPTLVPGGWRELRETVAALHAAGIGVILDLVFNHTAESDIDGPTLSMRGLDARAFYRHDAGGRLVNDTGTGNTADCAHPAVRRLVLDALHAFVLHAGVDGFRFDLATVLGRNEAGFDPHSPLLDEILSDPVTGSRVLIAEPWDIGPGGYQLGRYPSPFLEWNDRYRDDVRRFWRGDADMVGGLATRLAGSSDVFAGTEWSRTVNFIAAHDGMTLADITAYRDKHNLANGEDNRDGHDENLSWNNGVEGPSDDADIVAARRNDLRALLATLFVSRGTIMLTAGDEFGRTQHGNNNAYAQDNAITWLDWNGRDRDLESFVACLSELRGQLPHLSQTGFLDPASARWLLPDGAEMSVADWENPLTSALALIIDDGDSEPVAIAVNGTAQPCRFELVRPDGWRLLLSSGDCVDDHGRFRIGPRSVAVFGRKGALNEAR